MPIDSFISPHRAVHIEVCPKMAASVLKSLRRPQGEKFTNVVAEFMWEFEEPTFCYSRRESG